MQVLQLTEVDPQRRALATKAVKDALLAVGIPATLAMDRAVRIVASVLTTGNPCDFIGVQEDQIGTAATSFRAAIGSTGAATCDMVERGETVSPEPEPPAAEPVASLDARVVEALLAPLPADYTPTRPGALVMALLLGMCDGNAGAAFGYAKRLAVVSGQPDLFIDVARAIIAAYDFTPARLGGQE